MKQIKIVRRYADAFIGNIPQNKYEDVANQLKNLVSALDAETIKFLMSDIVDISKRLDFLNKVDARVGFSPEMKNLLVVLIKRKRIDLIQDIYYEYVRLMNGTFNKAYVTVETKYPLTDDIMSDIKESLGKRFKQEIVIKEKLNPAIIAGIIIKKDDLVMDLSLNGKLRNIKAKLIEKISN